jgi:NAD(P)-dependent dehydrogenase (short-subunit alcohol dehydrogenase family)
MPHAMRAQTGRCSTAGSCAARILDGQLDLPLLAAGRSVLAANGGGALVNMLSVTSFYTNPFDASYGASKVARQVFAAYEAGQIEVFAHERTRSVKAELSRDQELIYPLVQEFWDAAVRGQQDRPRAGDHPRGRA